MGNLFGTPSTQANAFSELSALDINKKPVDFSSLKGRVVLVSNVASK
jgi:glutathione peroxidase-family protein